MLFMLFIISKYERTEKKTHGNYKYAGVYVAPIVRTIIII